MVGGPAGWARLRQIIDKLWLWALPGGPAATNKYTNMVGGPVRWASSKTRIVKTWLLALPGGSAGENALSKWEIALSK